MDHFFWECFSLKFLQEQILIYISGGQPIASDLHKLQILSYQYDFWKLKSIILLPLWSEKHMKIKMCAYFRA